jgi:hypothetical protein
MTAGRAAVTASWITGNVLGDWAVRSGWLTRARTILQQAGEDGPEHGWVLIIKAFEEPDAQAREALLREAIAIGRRLDDPDIEFLALAHLGGLFVMTDRVDDGLAFSDEALAEGRGSPGLQRQPSRPRSPAPRWVSHRPGAQHRCDATGP